MRRHLREISRSFIIALLLAIVLPCASHAEESGTATATKKEKKTSLNFEDELIEGQTSKPELFYLFQKKNFNYKRLIRLRENFLPEMRKTSEDIQRSRSNN